MTDTPLDRLIRLADLHSQARRQDLVPFLHEQGLLHEELRSLRAVLAQAAPDLAAADLVPLTLAQQRHVIWCNRRLAAIQRRMAQIRVEMAGLKRQAARAEGRKLVLEQIVKAGDQDRLRKARRRDEDASIGPTPPQG